MKIRTIKTLSPIGLLTIRIRYYKDSEWVGTCDEISGFLTGGKNQSKKYIYEMVWDCVLACFGLTQHLR